MSPRDPRLTSCLLLGAGIALAAPVPTSAQEEPLRITLESAPGGFSPYASVRYTLWRPAGGAATLTVTATLPGGHGQERRAALIPTELLQPALAQLAACEPPPGEPPRGLTRARPRQRWRLHIERGDQTRALTLDDPHLLSDLRWARCLQTLRALADAAVGPVPFRDTFFLPEGHGLLSLASTPPARVLLDGQELHLLSPLPGLRVAVGEHTVRFVDPEAGIDRTYTVRVLPGVTTRLDVELW